MKRQSQYTIRDEGNLLLVRVQAPWQLWERLGGAVLAAIVVSMVVQTLFHAAWWPVVGIALGVLQYFALPGLRKAELRMSALECYTKANFSKSLSNGRTVLTGDILWLEYNEQGFSPNARAGLYAARRSGSICLLPLLDGQQTTEVIAAIEAKFAGLAEDWQKNSPYGKSVQTILSR